MTDDIDREQLYTALRNADKAGDTKAARRLAEYIHSLPKPSASHSAPQSAGDQVPGGGQAGNRNVGKPSSSDEPRDNALGVVAGPFDAALTAGVNAVAGVAGNVAGVGKSILSGKFGTQQGANEGEEFGNKVAAKLSRQPATQTGRKILEKTAPVAEALGAVPASELATLAHAGAPAVEIAGNAAGGAAKQVGAKLSSMGGAVVPKIDAETARLAQKAHDYGIPLRPDMLYKNKLAKMAGEAAEKVPLSGSQAGQRQTAFNRAIIKVIGGDPKAEKLTPDVFDQAIRSAGQKIGDIAAKTPLKIDKNLSQALDSHLANVAKYETSDVARAVTSYIEDLREKAQEGIVPGEAFRKLNTKINSQLRTTSNGDLKHALGQLQDDLHEALERGLSGHDLATLKAARTQYAAAKTIEPLVAKSAAGDISPAGLMGRVTSNNAGKSRMARGRGGELGDLARIGQRFLKEPQSSGTAERGLVYGMAGGGVVAEPHTAAAVYGAANAYNRTGAAIARKLTPKLSDLAGKGGN